MDAIRPLLIFGTRPETIKMAPVIRECQARAGVDPIVCSTGQHREMLIPLLEYFDIEPDIQLDLMRPNQTLSGLTARCLEGLDETIQKTKPDCVVAQGDTTTVMAASVVSFYHQLPFVHVEAGLRTRDIKSPWPEEFNRRVASLTAAIHCAPTQQSAQNLIDEGIPDSSVYVTGNTVVDALLWTIGRERSRSGEWQQKYHMLGDRRVVLVTGHRRESFGEGFESICRALKALSRDFSDVEFVYPVHLNPNVRKPVFRLLGGAENIHLIEPVPYPEFAWLMDRSTLIVTDSGGVQEEAPSLRKPVIVMRQTTERQEAVDSGAARLVGTDPSVIARALTDLLTNPVAYAAAQANANPYGDGKSAQRVTDAVLSIRTDPKPRSATVAA